MVVIILLLIVFFNLFFVQARHTAHWFLLRDAIGWFAAEGFEAAGQVAGKPPAVFVVVNEWRCAGRTTTAWPFEPAGAASMDTLAQRGNA